MRASIKFLAASVAFAIAAPSYAVAIVNGGFEAPPVPGAGGISFIAAGPSSLPGWYVVAGSNSSNAGLLINTGYSEPPAFPADSGSTSYDITGGGNTGANAIYQDLATVIGQIYNLTFALGNAPGPDPRYTLPSSVDVFAGVAGSYADGVFGGFSQSFSNGIETLGQVNWAQQSFQFTATSTNTRVAFQNTTPVQGSADNFAGLDTISIAAVPEAATWGMMVLGFGMLGFSMRSRRRTDVSFG